MPAASRGGLRLHGSQSRLAVPTRHLRISLAGAAYGGQEGRMAEETQSRKASRRAPPSVVGNT